MENNPYDAHYEKNDTVTPFAENEPSGNSYDSFYDEQETKRKSQDQAVASLRVAKLNGPDPDRYAEATDLSKKVGLAPDFVASNFDKVKKEFDTNDNRYDDLVKKTPEFFKDQANANIAKDDLDSLSKINSQVEDAGFFKNLYNSAMSGGARIASGLAKSASTIYDSQAALPPGLYDPTQEDVVPEALYKNPLTNYLDKKADQYAPKEMSLSWSTEFRNGNFENAGKALAYNIVSNAPQLGLIIMNPAVGLGTLGLSSAGSSMAENLENGVDPSRARSGAILNAGIETGIESLGGIGSPGFKELVKDVVSEVGEKTAKELFKTGIKKMAVGGAQEGAEEAATTLAQAVVDYGLDINPQAFDGIGTQMIDSAGIGFGSGSTMTGVALSAEMGSRKLQSNFQLMQNMNAYQNIGEILKESKLFKRSPEKAKAYLTETLAGTGAEKVFIDVDAFDSYFQSENKSGSEAAAELSIADQYAKASEAGGDIELNMADWAVMTANTDYYQGLAKDIRFTQTQESMRQLEEEKAAAKKEVAQVSDESKLEAVEKIQAERLNAAEEVASLLKSKRRAESWITQAESRIASNPDMAPEEVSFVQSKIELVRGQIENLETTETAAEKAKRRNLQTKEVSDYVMNQLMAQGFTRDEARANATVWGERYWSRAERSGFAKTPIQFAQERFQGFNSMDALDVGVGVIDDRSNVVDISDLIAMQAGPEFDSEGNRIYQPDIVTALRASIDRGEAGEVLSRTSEDGEVLGALGKESSFPEFFKNKGYTKKETLKIIDKHLAGEKLTEKQQAIFDDLYSGAFDSTARREFFQSDRPFQTEIPMPEAVQNIELTGTDASPKEAQAEFAKRIQGTSVQNAMTGWEIEFSKIGKKKAGSTLADQGQLIAYLNIDKLMQNAVLARTEADRLGRDTTDGLRAIHIFYAPFSANGKDYVVSIKVRDTNEGKKFYDKFTIEKEKPAAFMGESWTQTMSPATGNPESADATRSQTRGAIDSQISIDQFLQDVKELQRQDAFFQSSAADIFAGKEDVLAKLDEILPVTGDQQFDDAAREALRKDPKKWAEYEALLDRIGTKEERAKAMGFGNRTWFHGSSVDIQKFEREALGASTNAQSAKQGFFFAEDPSTASDYAELAKERGVSRETIREGSLYRQIADFEDRMQVKYGPGYESKMTNEEFGNLSELQNTYEAAQLDVMNSPQAKIEVELKELRTQRLLLSKGSLTFGSGTAGVSLNGTAYTKESELDDLIKTWSKRAKDNPEDADLWNRKVKSAENAKLYLSKDQNKLAAINAKIEKLEDALASVGQNVMAVRLKGDKSNIRVRDYAGESYRDTSYADEMRWAQGEGKTGVLFRNTYDPADPENRVEQDIAAVFEPSQIRSIYAAYDPRFANSTDVLAQSGESAPRGRIRFGRDRMAIIDLFQHKDKSTVMHESAHLWLEETIEDAYADYSNDGIRGDLDTLLKWFNLDVRTSDGEAAVRAAIQVTHHEQFAEGFEAYIMEGKAPNDRLAKAFAAFRVWLTNIYGAVRNIRVPLNQEVREVMDRLVSAEAAARQSEMEYGYNPLLGVEHLAMMSDMDRADYLLTIEEAKEEVRKNLTQDYLNDLQQREKRLYKETLARITDEETKRLNEDLALRTENALRAGKMPDGSDLPADLQGIKIDRASLIQLIGPEIDPRIQKMTSRKEGLPVEAVAEMFGWDNPKDMIFTIQRTPSFKNSLAESVESRMQEVFPDRFDPDTAIEDAAEHYHNQAQEKLHRLEIKFLKDNAPSLGRKMIEILGKTQSRAKFYKEAAAKTIMGSLANDITAYRYQQTERKKNLEAHKAFGRGDFDLAMKAKHESLLNFELYKEAKKLEERKVKDSNLFSKIFKPDSQLGKTRDMHVVSAARALVNYIDGDSEADIMAPLKKLEGIDPDAYQNMVNLVNNLLPIFKGPQEITVDDYYQLSDAIGAMWDYSREIKQLTIGEGRIEVQEAIDGMMAELAPRTLGQSQAGMDKALGWKEKALLSFQSLKASITRMEQWTLAMGPSFHKYLYEPLVKADTTYKNRKAEELTKLNELVAKLGPQSKEPIVATGLGYEFKDITEVLGAMIHTGNTSNLERLLKGRNWGDTLPDGSLDTSRWDAFIAKLIAEGKLDKSHYDFLQSVWDFMESHKVEAWKTHYKLQGFYPKEITPSPIETPFGTYRGGYAPVVYDSDIRLKVDKATSSEITTNANSLAPSVGSGFTKERADNFFDVVKIDLNSLVQATDKTLKYTYLQPAIVGATRLINSDQFNAGLNQYDRTVVDNMIRPAIMRLARQSAAEMATTSAGRWTEKKLNTLRGRTSLMLMALNVPNWFQNLTGAIAAGADVSPATLARSAKNYLKNPLEFNQMIISKSEYMKARSQQHSSKILETFDKVLNAKSGWMQKAEDFRTQSVEFAYIGERISNALTGSIAWSAAYSEAIDSGLSESEAVSKADSIVRTTQGDGSSLGVSNLESGGAFLRMFSMFSTFFNGALNKLMLENSLASQEQDKLKANMRRARAYMFVVALPVVASSMIMRAFSGTGLDGDDDGEYTDDLVDMFLIAQVRFLAAGVPVVGAFINFGINKLTSDKAYNDKISSPVFSVIEQATDSVDFINKLYEDEEITSRDSRAVAYALGLMTGLPTTTVSKPVGYLLDVDAGKADPSGPIDFTRGLVTGRRGN